MIDYIDDNKKSVYQILKGTNFFKQNNLPDDEQSFNSSLDNDENYAKRLYDYMATEGYDDSYDNFNKYYRHASQSNTAPQNGTPTSAANAAQKKTASVQPTQNTQQKQRAQQIPTQKSPSQQTAQPKQTTQQTQQQEENSQQYSMQKRPVQTVQPNVPVQPEVQQSQNVIWKEGVNKVFDELHDGLPYHNAQDFANAMTENPSENTIANMLNQWQLKGYDKEGFAPMLDFVTQSPEGTYENKLKQSNRLSRIYNRSQEDTFNDNFAYKVKYPNGKEEYLPKSAFFNIIEDGDNNKKVVVNPEILNNPKYKGIEVFGRTLDNLGNVKSKGWHTLHTYLSKDTGVAPSVEEIEQSEKALGTRYYQESVTEGQLKDTMKNVDDAFNAFIEEGKKQQKNKSFATRLQEAFTAEDLSTRERVKNSILGTSSVPGTDDADRIRKFNLLSVAHYALKDAQDVINEAKKSRKEGDNVGAFLKGAGRGIANKLFDVRTWDGGITDTETGTMLLQVLNKADKEKPLTREEQALLDAKVVELSVNAYFGSYLGRGYKAGQVTASSLPFMLEMAINPASAMGRSWQSMLTRYALKRFGKQMLKKKAGKYLAAKIGTRVLGDAAGSMVMAGTTGIGHVSSDLVNRQIGDIQTDIDPKTGKPIYTGRTNKENFGTALYKAFMSTTIENYSEMVGEYFKPVLGVFGKGASKLYGKAKGKLPKGKISTTLDDVQTFIQGVNKSNFAKALSDFQRRTQWQGTIPEYAEEVAGNIMNGLLVGDQTFDTDEQTGIFNLDNNIDTFLGVSLMGGFMSSIKTASYRTPKYMARKQMLNADKQAAKLFDTPQEWYDLRNKIADGTNEDIKEAVADVLMSDYPEEKKRAILNYVMNTQQYKGHLQSDETEEEPTDVATMIDQYEQALPDVTPEEELPVQQPEDEQQPDPVQGEYDSQKQAVSNDLFGELRTNGLIYTDPETGEEALWKVQYNGGEWYVVGMNKGTEDGGSDFAILKDEQGNVSVVPTTDLGLDTYERIPLDQMADAALARRGITPESIQQQHDFSQNHNPQTKVLSIGDTYTAPDGTKQIVVGEADGKLVVRSAQFDTEQQHYVEDPKSPTRELTQDELANEQDAYFNAQDQQNAPQQGQDVTPQNGTEPTPTTQPAYQKPSENPEPFTIGDQLTFYVDGKPIQAEVVQPEDEDGVVVQTSERVNGHIVAQYTREQLDRLTTPPEQTTQQPQQTELPPYDGNKFNETHPAEEVKQPQQVSSDANLSTQNDNKVNETKPQSVASTDTRTPQPTTVSALSRIPQDENGEPLYTQADPQTAWQALTEQTEGDTGMAKEVASSMLSDLKAELKQAKKQKPAGGKTVTEKIQAQKEHKANIDRIQNEINQWQEILNQSKKKEAPKENTIPTPKEATQASVVKDEAPTTDHVIDNNKKVEEENTQQENVKLSNEVDENGRQFVLNSEGNLAFGEITEDTGLTAAPILLSEGMITNRATNDGYGLAHIEARHGEEIRKAGYKSVLDFIEQVAKNYDVIKEGNMRDGRPTYRLMLTDKHNNTLMVELSGDGTYWNINTAGIFKTSYGRKNKEVYNRHTTDKQSVETTETSQDAEQSDTQAPSRMNVPTTSESKDTEPTSNDQQTDQEKSLSAQVEEASADVNTSPTEAQKEAGNYKKGHVQIGTFDVTIEQPQGSIRRGTDEKGRHWESKMHNTYGYFRGTEGVDGDHIDVFLSNDIDGWNGRKVFVVDQYNPDGTFDEHKVMLGFNDIDDAKSDYLANYEKGWEDGRKIVVSEVNLEDFEKWIESSHRKTKPFAEYAGVKKETSTEGASIEQQAESIVRKKDTDYEKSVKFGHDDWSDSLHNKRKKVGKWRVSELETWLNKERKYLHDISQEIVNAENDGLNHPAIPVFASTQGRIAAAEERLAELKGGKGTDSPTNTSAESKAYTITPSTYTNKKGKTTKVSLLTFDKELTAEQEQAVKEFAKERVGEGRYSPARGWKDRESGGWIFRKEDDARMAAEMIDNKQAVDDNQPLSLDDVRNATEETKPNEETPKQEEKQQGTEETRQNQEETKEPKNEGQFKLVSDERMEELKRRLREKLRNQMNVGVDPEMLSLGIELAVGYIDRGVKKFSDFAKKMIEDMGDGVRPYLKAFYNGVRDMPEITSNGYDKELTTYDEVRTFDTANFDKQSRDIIEKAKMMANEEKANADAEEAKNSLTDTRNQQRIEAEVGTEPKLRPATEEDMEQNPIVYYEGKPCHIMMLVRTGEQVNASGFSKPKITGVYLTNGKSVNLEDLQVEDDGTQTETQSEDKKSQKQGDTEINRKFATAVKNDMLSALEHGTKPYRSIVDLRKRAKELGMDVDSEGRTDILIQELVEDGLVRAAREVAERYGSNSKETYDHICKLYEMQPTIAARSSNRIKMQQYSTPLPMAWNAAHFAMTGRENGKVLEPTAGNGMLVFNVPTKQVHANELDETRLDNLKEQGFAQVTNQDATKPFKGGQQYDVVIANPPFGKSEAKEYDGKLIGGLDPQITLNALASMKDNGKAAIIIGGNMEYGNNGAIKSMQSFFTYLYDHYNVKGVVDMDGKLYAKQGTTFPTRMILIDGRRSEEERAQSAVFPPVQSQAVRKAESFEDLYNIIEELTNSKEKSNGTEILRSQQGQLLSDAIREAGRSDGRLDKGQHRENDVDGHRRPGESELGRGVRSGELVLRGEHRENTGNDKTPRKTDTNTGRRSGGNTEPVVSRVGNVGVSENGVGLTREQEQQKKRTLTEEKLPYRPHNTAFSLESVAPAAMVEAMDNILKQIEKQYGSIDDFVTKELGYDTVEDAHNALAAEQMDSVAMAVYQMKQGHAMIIGDQTGVGKGRQMAALIRWAHKRGEKPIFITQKADLFSDIYRDLVDVGSGDLVPFIFNSPTGENKGEMVDANGKVVYKGLPKSKMDKVLATGKMPDEYDYAVLTYSQVNTGDDISQAEARANARQNGTRIKKSASSGKATPKATFLRAIAENNYLLLDESHTAAGASNTGAYLQSIVRRAKAVTFASATFAKRPDTMPMYALRTAMSEANVDPGELIKIIEKGGVTLQEIMSRALTDAGQMVRRERDMTGVVTDWKTIDDPETVQKARENYDSTIVAFNAIIKFQDEYVKPFLERVSRELAVMASSAGIKKGTNKMGIENTPFASKAYNYTKQLMLALKTDAIVDAVEKEIKAGRHPVIALESTMESSIKEYNAGEVITEPTFAASLLRGLESVMQYSVKSGGVKTPAVFTPKQLGPAGEKAYYELQDFIRKSTSGVFVSPLDAMIERLHERGYKVGEMTGRDMYVERNEKGEFVARKRTDKDKKRMQREFNNGQLDVLILNKSASTGISLHASEKFGDQRQRTMIIAQPLSDINDYMQMIGRIDRTGQVHRGYYINLGLPVPAENRFLMMLSTKLKSLNANTTTSQDSESNEVEAPDLLNKYGSQVIIEYLRDNPDVYEKMGSPLSKQGDGGKKTISARELEEYTPQEDDARKITGFVALLPTKEQEDFYDDVTRRYNELIKYLNDTGNNDLKITVMPLRAKVLDKRVSSEGRNPNGNNPFAQNSYVEKVEMDVLRKPMKADDVRKTIKQINKDKAPSERLGEIRDTIKSEDDARLEAENARYEKAKQRAKEDIAKQTEKINGQKKRTEEEKQQAIADYTKDTNESVEAKHEENVARINLNQKNLVQRLRMFDVGKSYLVPDNLEDLMMDYASPAIFCGFKAKDKKVTASTTLAVFATLDGRRRVEVKLSQILALEKIKKMTNDNWDIARSTTLDNWDSQIPKESRKEGYIMTGNILQAISDTQDEKGGFPGQLISYTDMEGNIHDGVLMPDKWVPSRLRTTGVPLISRMQQIKDYVPVTSLDGNVIINGSRWAHEYHLIVPKTKKAGAIYFENETLLDAAGGNFYPYRGKLRADIPESKIEQVVNELSKLGVKAVDEAEQEKLRFRDRSDNTTPSSDPKAMADTAVELGRQLGEEVEVITDPSQITDPDPKVQERKRKAKGWFDAKTGKVVINLSAHKDQADVEQTALHEIVGHKGMRALVGEENFNEFLDNIYNHASNPVRHAIDNLAKRKGLSQRTATEEYMAGLAEEGFSDRTNANLWQQIKQWFSDMISKAGTALNFKISDRELRYLLWKSHKLQTAKGRESIIDRAKDIAVQNKLGVGNNANLFRKPKEEKAPLDPDTADLNTLFRDADDPVDYEKALARDAYENRLKSNLYQVREAVQDSMLSLHEAMKDIWKAAGKKFSHITDIPTYQNPYIGENELSSVNQAEVEEFKRTLFDPLLKEVNRLAPNADARAELTDYMMAKHGLERNIFMAERNAKIEYDRELKKNPQTTKTLQDFIDKNRKKDFAGLTALTEEANVADAESIAEQMVDGYEATHNTDRLWAKTKAVTNFIVQKQFDSGYINNATRKAILKAYDNYIPLRGFAENTADDVYAYMRHSNSAFNAPIKTARGRKSKADDPFANMRSMAESGILRGNRNRLVKLPLLNFVQENPSDLISVSDVWLKYNNTLDEWEVVNCGDVKGTKPIELDDTPEQVEQKMKIFNGIMTGLASAHPDKYRKQADAPDIPYRVINNSSFKEHQIVITRNGRDYILTVNGNPRLAQAVNGLSRPDNRTAEWYRKVEGLTRWLSKAYTQLNPGFAAANFVRDALYSNSSAWTKESPNYAWKYNRNFAKNIFKTYKLYNKQQRGTLDMHNPTERMFKEFIDNGGETGYYLLKEVRQQKAEIEKDLKRLNGKLSLKKAFGYLGKFISYQNKVAENTARFSAYKTSRQFGRSAARAAYDAKQISVNFNKKGAGSRYSDTNGQKKLASWIGYGAQFGRGYIPFFNAGIQGTTNYLSLFKHNQWKAGATTAGLFILGAMMGAGDGDDGEDEDNGYYNIPGFIRRSNITFKIGTNSYVTIPLPLEFRVAYGMGELATSVLSGKERLSSGELTSAVASLFSQVLPIDIMEGGDAVTKFIPGVLKPVAEVYLNKSWTGLPIYKDTPFNKNTPEYLSVYKNANTQLVEMSKFLSELTGGDPHTRGWLEINPQVVEYLLKGYTGGIQYTVDKAIKTAETIFGDREYNPGNILILDRFVKQPDDRTQYRQINNEYHNIEDNAKALNKRLNGYNKDTREGIVDYAKKIQTINYSPEYRYMLIYQGIQPHIKKLEDKLKEDNDKLSDREKSEIEASIQGLKKLVVEQVRQEQDKKSSKPLVQPFLNKEFKDDWVKKRPESKAIFDEIEKEERGKGNKLGGEYQKRANDKDRQLDEQLDKLTDRLTDEQKKDESVKDARREYLKSARSFNELIDNTDATAKDWDESIQSIRQDRMAYIRAILKVLMSQKNKR